MNLASCSRLQHKYFKRIFNRTIYAGEGVGSGVIDNDGHIITNKHVVAGAKWEVTVSLSDGSTVTGTL